MNQQEAYDWMESILQGQLPSDLKADLLDIESRGPTVAELVGCASAMRESMHPVRAEGLVLDTCGTGGAPVKTFNISTPAAFLLADAGITIAKHGNRSVTRPSGSADILEACGANLAMGPSQVEVVLQEAGIAFLFAPTFHPAMRHAAPVRKEIGKSIFNRLGPLANPARASHQLVGVGDKSELQLMADALHQLGVQGIVLHGDPGFDEATPCGPIHWLRIGESVLQTTDPQSLGLAPCDPETLAPLTGEAAVARFQSILGGDAEHAIMDTIHLNVAFGLLAAGQVDSVPEGLRKARTLTGKRKWDAYVAATQRHA